MKFFNTLPKFFNILQQITVEPIGFFKMLSLNLYQLILHTGLYEVICYQEYQGNNSTVCKNFNESKEVEDHVQQVATRWNMVFALAHFFPAIFAHVLLGAWGDISGRKINILIGIMGLLINAFPLSIFFEFNQTSLWFFALANFISGGTGYLGITTISSFAYLSDIVKDKNKLTFRMVVYSTVATFAGIVGSLLGATLVKKLKLSYIIILVEIFLAFAFFYAIFRLKQISPKLIHLKNRRDPKIFSVDVKTYEKKKKHSYFRFVAIKSKNLLAAVFKTYTRKRTGRRRIYIWLICLVYFIHLFAEMGLRGNVTSLFVLRRPLEWSGSTLGYWKACHSLMLCLGNLIGGFVFKKWLKLNETTILMISLASGCVELLVTGLSQHTWTMYLAIVLGMFSHLFVATVKSFTSSLVDTDEVGKSYIVYGLAADLGHGILNMVANAMYGSTVKYYPGFVFYLGSCMLALSGMIVLRIHVNLKKESQGQTNETSLDFKSGNEIETETENNEFKIEIKF